MNSHQRRGAFVLGAVLLATAIVLGISRSNRPTPASEVAVTSHSGSDAGHFPGIPRASDVGHEAEDRLAGKTGQREPRRNPLDEIDQPRPGEAVYRMDNLPEACGTYWVQTPTGGFSRLSVCHPEKHPGGGH